MSPSWKKNVFLLLHIEISLIINNLRGETFWSVSPLFLNLSANHLFWMCEVVVYFFPKKTLILVVRSLSLSTSLYEKTHKSPWWLGPWNLWNIFGAFRKCPCTIPTFHHHTRCVTYCSHLCWMMRKSIGHGGQGIKMPGSIITNDEIWHSSAWKETKK